MKIAVFVSYLPPHLGGIEAVAFNQILALATAGHDVTAVSSAQGLKAGIIIKKNYRIRRIRIWNFAEERLGAPFPLFSPSLLWHSYAAIKKADVVHMHDAFYITSLVASVWARILKKPLVLTQHVDMIPHPSRLVNTVQKIVYATTGGYVIRSSSKIIVLNSRVKEFLLNRGIDDSRIVFLPNGVDTGAFSPATKKYAQRLREKYHLPKQDTLVLFVGRFVPKKGFSKLMKVKPMKSVSLVFAGGDKPSGYVRSDHFFIGSVDRKDIADIYKMCDVFILPSNGEGFPVTIQEAMASGLPIITTDDEAYNLYHLNRDNVAFINPTVRGITDSLRKVIASDTSRIKMAKYSREYAIQNFGWERNITQMLRVYQEVMV